MTIATNRGFRNCNTIATQNWHLERSSTSRSLFISILNKFKDCTIYTFLFNCFNSITTNLNVDSICIISYIGNTSTFNCNFFFSFCANFLMSNFCAWMRIFIRMRGITRCTHPIFCVLSTDCNFLFSRIGSNRNIITRHKSNFLISLTRSTENNLGFIAILFNCDIIGCYGLPCSAIINLQTSCCAIPINIAANWSRRCCSNSYSCCICNPCTISSYIKSIFTSIKPNIAIYNACDCSRRITCTYINAIRHC